MDEAVEVWREVAGEADEVVRADTLKRNSRTRVFRLLLLGIPGGPRHAAEAVAQSLPIFEQHSTRKVEVHIGLYVGMLGRSIASLET